MFKIIMNVEKWDTLYMSEHADAALREFMPKLPISEGTQSGFYIRHLKYSGSKANNRPRMVILITEDRDSMFHISNSLLLRMDENLTAIVKGRNLTAISRDRLAIEKYCRVLDRYDNPKERWSGLPEKWIGDWLVGTLGWKRLTLILSLIVGLVAWFGFSNNQEDETIRKVIKIEAVKSQDMIEMLAKKMTKTFEDIENDHRVLNKKMERDIDILGERLNSLVDKLKNSTNVERDPKDETGTPEGNLGQRERGSESEKR